MSAIFTLSKTIKHRFFWQDHQLEIFFAICREMGCGPAMEKLIDKIYPSELEALKELNILLQQYLFREGERNPFKPAKERYELHEHEFTTLHTKVAELIVKLGSFAEKIPTRHSAFPRIVMLVLGSTVPNMRERADFANRMLNEVLPDTNLILGLSGDRILLAPSQNAGGYLGDIGDHPSVLTSEQAATTVKFFNKEGQPTEAGAMHYLFQTTLEEKWRDISQIINATSNPPKTRPDTTDTAHAAALHLRKHHPSIDFDQTLFVVVTDALFAAQMAQIRTGFLQAGIAPLRPEQLILCGKGYPDSILKEKPAYVQIAVSAIAENAFRLTQELEAEATYAASRASASSRAGTTVPFFMATGSTKAAGGEKDAAAAIPGPAAKEDAANSA